MKISTLLIAFEVSSLINSVCSHLADTSLNLEAKCIHTFDLCYQACSDHNQTHVDHNDEHRMVEEDSHGDESLEELEILEECLADCHADVIACDTECSMNRDTDDIKFGFLGLLVALLATFVITLVYKIRRAIVLERVLFKKRMNAGEDQMDFIVQHHGHDGSNMHGEDDGLHHNN